MRAAFLLLAVVVAAANAALPGDQSVISPPGCGVQKIDPIISDEPGKVVGGVEAKIGSWPWQGMLRYNGRHLCGGSLMNSIFFVTAAHCTDGRTAATLTVHLGMHNQNTPESHALLLNVQRINQHENYGSSLTRNDISLLKFTTAVTYTDYIIPVCLGTNPTSFYVNQKAYATGWGTTSSGGSTAVRLQQVGLRVTTDAECTAHYNSIQYQPDMMICGGDIGDNMDTCQGDSGGPYVFKNGNAWELIGITSWGRGCGDIGVYARVANYITWIQGKIQN